MNKEVKELVPGYIPGLDKELLNELQEMIDNGCGLLEVFEYIQDNTDEDPCIYIDALM